MVSRITNPGEQPPMPKTTAEFVVEALRLIDRQSHALNMLASIDVPGVQEITIRRFSDLSGVHLFIAADNLRYDLPDDLDGSVACEGCQKMVRPDDSKHVYESGETLCEACAPAYADAVHDSEVDARIGEDDEMREERDRIKELHDKHIADGGSPDDKWLTHGGKEG